MNSRLLSSFSRLSISTPSTPLLKAYSTAPVGLHNLGPASGSQHSRKRLGRGQGSGRGGTSTRGHKGQKARSGNGKPKAGFEGGQTPITRRYPKRGFTNPTATEYAPVNLDRLQFWIDSGRLTSSREHPITARELLLSGCVHNLKDGVKLLGDGASYLKSAVHLEVSRASQTAIEAVERAGGSVVCKYYNDLALKDLVHERSDRKQALPVRKSDILWYTSWRNRGYLSKEPGSVQQLAPAESSTTTTTTPAAQ